MTVGDSQNRTLHTQDGGDSSTDIMPHGKLHELHPEPFFQLRIVETQNPRVHWKSVRDNFDSLLRLRILSNGDGSCEVG